MKEALGCPILGDTIYAQIQRQLIKMPRLMLHAWKLEFQHPITKLGLKFEAPVPEAFGPWMKKNG
ncbi:hypothetical protein [Verrucomicrobium spinosum]